MAVDTRQLLLSSNPHLAEQVGHPDQEVVWSALDQVVSERVEAQSRDSFTGGVVLGVALGAAMMAFMPRRGDH